MGLLMGGLAVGLFSSGCGYCENLVFGHTPIAFVNMPAGKFWQTTVYGGGFFYVYGYHQHPSILRTVVWWEGAAGKILISRMAPDPESAQHTRCYFRREACEGRARLASSKAANYALGSIPV